MPGYLKARYSTSEDAEGPRIFHGLQWGSFESLLFAVCKKKVLTPLASMISILTYLEYELAKLRRMKIYQQAKAARVVTEQLIGLLGTQNPINSAIKILKVQMQETTVSKKIR